jgi:hypothetical protein
MTVHIDEGFDFLGFRIQRQTKRGSNKRFESAWDPWRLRTLEVRMEHGTAPVAEAVPG